MLTLAASVALAIVVSKNPAGVLSRNWFWAFIGVNCLGLGISFYVHGLITKNGLCKIAACILLGLGLLWLFTDIVFNGANGVVGGGWWIGLIVGVAVGLVCYFVPVVIEKNKK